MSEIYMLRYGPKGLELGLIASGYSRDAKEHAKTLVADGTLLLAFAWSSSPRKEHDVYHWPEETEGEPTSRLPCSVSVAAPDMDTARKTVIEEFEKSFLADSANITGDKADEDRISMRRALAKSIMRQPDIGKALFLG